MVEVTVGQIVLEDPFQVELDRDQNKTLAYHAKHIRALWHHLQKLEKCISIGAGDTITITTGAASIVMRKDGTIVVKGTHITVEALTKVEIKAQSEVVIKGAKISQN
jgi:hypothetical protein